MLEDWEFQFKEHLKHREELQKKIEKITRFKRDFEETLERTPNLVKPEIREEIEALEIYQEEMKGYAPRGVKLSAEQAEKDLNELEKILTKEELKKAVGDMKEIKEELKEIGEILKEVDKEKGREKRRADYLKRGLEKLKSQVNQVPSPFHQIKKHAPTIFTLLGMGSVELSNYFVKGENGLATPSATPTSSAKVLSTATPTFSPKTEATPEPSFYEEVLGKDLTENSVEFPKSLGKTPQEKPLSDQVDIPQQKAVLG